MVHVMVHVMVLKHCVGGVDDNMVVFADVGPDLFLAPCMILGHCLQDGHRCLMHSYNSFVLLEKMPQQRE